MTDNVNEAPVSPDDKSRAKFEAAKDTLHKLLLSVPAAAVRFDAQTEDYRAGVADAIFIENRDHLHGKLLGYGSVGEFLAYYTSSEPGVWMLSYLSGRKCTESDAILYKKFMMMAWNNNIGEYTATLQQPEIWAEYLKKSKVDSYGNIANWGKFYCWLHKNADVSWCRFLLGKFLTYR